VTDNSGMKLFGFEPRPFDTALRDAVAEDADGGPG
jgi:hypothetical protein